MKQDTPYNLRQQIRRGELQQNTSGLAPGYVQCNLVILPKQFADDFREFCELNSQSCPLIGSSEFPGDFCLKMLGEDINIRTDIPAYQVFKDGAFSAEVTDITDIWEDDFVAFLLGCSFSFEEALIAAGLEIRNITESKNVPMYKTNIDTQGVGQFTGKMVVSMRPLNPTDANKAIEICNQYPKVHGAPVHLGNPSAIGIDDITQPDFGEAVTINAGEEPVFWACGVTPQLAIANAKPTICITHSPGHMLITDILNSSLRSASGNQE